MDHPQQIELTIEQQFSLRAFEAQVEQMSLEQARDLLVQLHKTMMYRESTWKHLLKHQWDLPNKGC